MSLLHLGIMQNMRSLNVWVYRICLIVAFIHDTYAQKLTPKYTSIMENGTAKLNCASDISMNAIYILWKVNDSTFAKMDHLSGCRTYFIETNVALDKSSLAFECVNETLQKLVIRDISRMYQGYVWKCSVVVSSSASESNEAFLNVLYPPLVDQMADVSVIEKSTYNRTCPVTPGYPEKMSLTWSRQIDNFSRSEKYLVLENVSRSDTSSYTCAVNNTMTPTEGAAIPGKDRSSFNLDVLYPPSIRLMANVTVIEGDSLIKSCPISDGNPSATSVKWTNEKTATIPSQSPEGVLNLTNISRKDDRRYTCEANNTMLPTDGKTVFGQSYGWFKLTVAYPPRIEQMTKVKVIEHSTYNRTCQITPGNPKKTLFIWTRSMDNSVWKDKYLILEQISRNDTSAYTCTVNNTMTPTEGSALPGKDNSSFYLDVLYPPSIGPMTNVTVIEGDSLNKSCPVSKGNPSVTSVKWTDGEEANVQEQSAEDILYLTNISRKDDRRYTCEANNTMSPTDGKTVYEGSTGWFKLTVAYPPRIEQMTRVKVIEHSTYNRTCQITPGNPKKTLYIWTRIIDNYVWRDKNLILEQISRNDTSIYTCTVNNTMTPTEGSAIPGKDNSSFYLDVLYPPSIGPMTNVTVIEGDSLNKSCPVSKGNPSVTSVKWTDEEEANIQEQSAEGILYLTNISRKDDRRYTCEANNTMLPTDGKTVYEGSTGWFKLTVAYPPKIIEIIRNVSAIENSTFIKKCLFTPGLPSNTSIKWTGHLGRYKTSSVTLSLPILSRTYSSYYTCIVNNTMTPTNGARVFGDASVSFYLNVMFPASVGVLENRSIAEGSDLNITCPVITGNPEKSHFYWERKRYNQRFNQSNIIIQNATGNDSGMYTCTVYNEMLPTEGNLTRYLRSNSFHLNVFYKPQTPVNFTCIYQPQTGSSLTIRWDPGSNGGNKQTFIINYKNKSDQVWHNLTVNENGDKSVVITIDNLQILSEYTIFMFAKNDAGQSGATEELLCRTQGAVKSNGHSQSGDSQSAGPVAGGVISGVLFVTAIAAVGIWLFKRRQGEKPGKPVYENVNFTESVKMSSKTSENSKRKETSSEVLAHVERPPSICTNTNETEDNDRLKVSELWLFVKESFGCIDAEFTKLPTGLQRPCTFARRPENIALNRFNGIYPYDHTRVKQDNQPDFFINACYIGGYGQERAYIASLGPTSITMDGFKTFWQMVWYERSDIIVMLTNLYEPSGMKCEQYWPELGTDKEFGGISVNCKEVESFAEYTIRTFTVTCAKKRRRLIQLHFTAWPDKTVPENVTSLLEFRQRVKMIPPVYKGPIVVHCSAGIGRTGTFIALDRLIEEGQVLGSVNVFACVERMREQRVNMVQTQGQYEYIYQALVVALAFEGRAIPLEIFKEFVETTTDNIYSKQFQHLQMRVETICKEESEAKSANRKLDKNRRGADTPGNQFRVKLNLGKEEDDSDYINAVYMNSFVIKDHFIVAQSALPQYVENFLCMIYQADCSCIVVMEDLQEPGADVGVYLPDDKSALCCGAITVYCSILERKPQYTVRKMELRYNDRIDDGEKKTVYHFEYTKWIGGRDTPMNAREFVQFTKDVEEYARLRNVESPVLVHCLKANERSVLFCAITVLISKLEIEGQVNVLNTLRHLRTRRQTAITSMEQLKFCYLALSAYIEMYK